MSSERVDCVVVGAGIVGLACARALAQAGREVLVAERESAIATGISARNSEVVHAGLYYPAGSLKARLCVRGRALLAAYCDSRGVALQRCGKLVLATDGAEAGALDRIAATAAAAGGGPLERLDAAQVAALEPALRCVAALHSPQTAIIDSQGLARALLADAEAAGASLGFASRVTGGRAAGGRVRLTVDAATPLHLDAALVVNCAGLHAVELARAFEGVPAAAIPTQHLAKGSYFAYAGRSPFRRLVYPVPQPGGLGIHATLDLSGQLRFGPDVQWVERPDYAVDPGRAQAFAAAVRRYWPGLPDGALQPAYAGVRPKLAGPGEAFADFRIDGPRVHGVAGLIQLFGIESPGLTASLAIAETVAAMAQELH